MMFTCEADKIITAIRKEIFSATFTGGRGTIYRVLERYAIEAITQPENLP